MNREIIITALPEFQPSAKIGKVNVKIGDKVYIGDTILSVEGKKGAKDITSEFEGTIVTLEVNEGDIIEKDALIGIIEVEETIEILSTNDEIKDHKEILNAEVLVLGGGPGGYVAGIRASQNGKKVILIEEDSLGGTCLNRGCIPTKSMVESTRVFDTVKNAEIFGIENSTANLSMEKIMNRKNNVVNTLVGGLDSSMEKHKIKVIKGKGIGFDKNSISVKTKDGNILVRFEKLIIATGSIVSLPNFEGANENDILTSDELLELKEIPKSLIILGGRVIAMEFAFIYNKLGSKVTVIQRSNSIFPNLDEDVIEIVRNKALQNGINLIEGTSVKKIKTTEDGQKVVIFNQNDEEKIVVAEKLAIATGRKPNLEGLKLEVLGVEIDQKTKGIKVDSTMKTTNDDIYAIGDVTNIYNLAHVASKQGIIAADNIMGNNISMKYFAVPEAVFTEPEIGLVGKNEKICKKEGISYIVGKFPYMNNGKSLVANEVDGFIKVIANSDDRKIIGASLIGLCATDLLAVFTNLIANGNTIDEAKDVIYAHPTVSETGFEAILDLDNESIHK